MLLLSLIGYKSRENIITLKAVLGISVRRDQDIRALGDVIRKLGAEWEIAYKRAPDPDNPGKTKTQRDIVGINQEHEAQFLDLVIKAQQHFEAKLARRAELQAEIERGLGDIELGAKVNWSGGVDPDPSAGENPHDGEADTQL